MTDLQTRRQIERWVDQIKQHLEPLHDGSFAKLCTRDEYRPIPDGWPTGGNETTSGGDTSRPTENAAINALQDRHSADYIHGRKVAAQRHLTRAIDELKQFSSAITEAERVEELAHERPEPAGSGHCQACDIYCTGNRATNDRIRAGYCHSCYRRWSAYPERPDRAAFEHDTPPHDQQPDRETA